VYFYLEDFLIQIHINTDKQMVYIITAMVVACDAMQRSMNDERIQETVKKKQPNNNLKLRKTSDRLNKHH